MIPSSLAEAKAKVASKTIPVVFKPSARLPFNKEGRYPFKITSSRYNEKTDVLSLTGVPYKNNKDGQMKEYQKITVCVPTAYTKDNGSIPINELFASLGLNPSEEVDVSFFEGKTVSVDISINTYVDEYGEITDVFYNAEGFQKI